MPYGQEKKSSPVEGQEGGCLRSFYISLSRSWPWGLRPSSSWHRLYIIYIYYYYIV